jgi:hypothetical protein
VRLLRRGRRPRETEKLGETLHDRRPIGDPVQQVSDLRADLVGTVGALDPGGGREDLDDRPVGDAVSVREAAALGHLCVADVVRDELFDEP